MGGDLGYMDSQVERILFWDIHKSWSESERIWAYGKFTKDRTLCGVRSGCMNKQTPAPIIAEFSFCEY
jgi:hypothetical protein